MRGPRIRPLMLVALLCLAGCRQAAEPAGDEPLRAEEPLQVSSDSDPRAVEIARAVMERMGGRESWDRTRFLSWKFFDRRTHHWDRWTGHVRIEGPFEDHEYLWLVNVNTREGRVWRDGEEITRPEELAGALETGRKIWVNDSYWLVMPYKLLDPGVTLKYSGEKPMEDGRPADVLDLTFAEGVGYTPENRYEVFVARDTGLVEQWSFYERASDGKPAFTLPWTGWRRFGGILLATGRGRGPDWPMAVHDDLPASVFTNPEPVGAPQLR